MEIKLLLPKLKDLYKEALDLIRLNKNIDSIFQFGLYVDDSVSSLVIAYNTIDHYSDSLKEEFIDTRNIPFENRWLIPEWYSEICENSQALNFINDFIQEYSNKKVDKSTLYHRDEVLDLLLDSLIFLEGSEEFKIFKDQNVMLFIQAGDSLIDLKMQKRIEKLISEKDYKEFLHDMEPNIE